MLSSSPLRLVHIAESIFFQYSACRSPCFPISFQGVVVSGTVEIPLSPARGRPCCCFRLVHIAENHLLSRCCSPPRAVGILSRPLSGARSVRAAVRIAKPRFPPRHSACWGWDSLSGVNTPCYSQLSFQDASIRAVGSQSVLPSDLLLGCQQFHLAGLKCVAVRLKTRSHSSPKI